MKEIWKDIKGYEDYYQISNLGNVKSKARYIYKSNGKAYVKILKKEKILKRYVRGGYYSVKLYNNNNKKNIPVHRLVAENFIKNIQNKPCINHKDGDKLNNKVNNLEWCTHSENTLHAYKNGLIEITEKQKENGRSLYKLGVKATSIKINQYDLDGNFIRQWKSISEANHSFGKGKTRINDACKNKCKQSLGYIWKYAKMEETNEA